MDVTATVGLVLATAIAIYSLLWLWRLPAALLTKLFWTLVAILIPGWGTMLFLEIYPPIAPDPSSRGGTTAQSKEAPLSDSVPPGLVAGFLAIVGLLYGGLWLVGGVAFALNNKPGSHLHVFGGPTLLVLGVYFMTRGSKQLSRGHERAAA